MSMQNFRFIRLIEKKLTFGVSGGGKEGLISPPRETNVHEKARE